MTYKAYFYLIIVHGYWTEWTGWTDCTKTCEGGTRYRTRTCTNPTPQYNGYQCNADGSSDREDQNCNTGECCKYIFFDGNNDKYYLLYDIIKRFGLN